MRLHNKVHILQEPRYCPWYKFRTMKCLHVPFFVEDRKLYRSRAMGGDGASGTEGQSFNDAHTCMWHNTLALAVIRWQLMLPADGQMIDPFTWQLTAAWVSLGLHYYRGHYFVRIHHIRLYASDATYPGPWPITRQWPIDIDVESHRFTVCMMLCGGYTSSGMSFDRGSFFAFVLVARSVMRLDVIGTSSLSRFFVFLRKCRWERRFFERILLVTVFQVGTYVHIIMYTTINLCLCYYNTVRDSMYVLTHYWHEILVYLQGPVCTYAWWRVVLDEKWLVRKSSRVSIGCEAALFADDTRMASMAWNSV